MRILIVEDEFLVSEALRLTLLEAGHQVIGVAANASTAVRLGAEHRPDLALIDVQLARGSCGIEAARTLNTEHGIASIFVTANPEMTRFARDISLGCLQKPYGDTDLLAILQIAEKIVFGDQASGQVA